MGRIDRERNAPACVNKEVQYRLADAQLDVRRMRHALPTHERDDDDSIDAVKLVDRSRSGDLSGAMAICHTALLE